MAHGPTSRDELHDAVAVRLRSADQRYTSGRRRLVELLAEAPRPETIPELLGRAPSLAQSSAYRNLVVLEEAASPTASSPATSARATSWPRTSWATTTT